MWTIKTSDATTRSTAASGRLAIWVVMDLYMLLGHGLGYCHTKLQLTEVWSRRSWQRPPAKACTAATPCKGLLVCLQGPRQWPSCLDMHGDGFRQGICGWAACVVLHPGGKLPGSLSSSWYTISSVGQSNTFSQAFFCLRTSKTIICQGNFYCLRFLLVHLLIIRIQKLVIHLIQLIFFLVYPFIMCCILTDLVLFSLLYCRSWKKLICLCR